MEQKLGWTQIEFWGLIYIIFWHMQWNSMFIQSKMFGMTYGFSLCFVLCSGCVKCCYKVCDQFLHKMCAFSGYFSSPFSCEQYTLNSHFCVPLFFSLQLLYHIWLHIIYFRLKFFYIYYLLSPFVFCIISRMNH